MAEINPQFLNASELYTLKWVFFVLHDFLLQLKKKKGVTTKPDNTCNKGGMSWAGRSADCVFMF
jgi:hypothetical protein